MGCNYYLRENRCECCGRTDEEKHIGKDSVGWQFSFQGYRAEGAEPGERIVSYADWLKRLDAGGEIYDEYGDRVTLDEFKALVQAKQSEPRNYAIYCQPRYPGLDVWLDAEGYSFSGGYFS